MVKTTENNSDTAATEQLAAHPAQIPTHPDEKKSLPAPNIVPDGVSPPIQHPLDPLNADEINLTTRLLLASSKFQKYMRIIAITPNEPDNKQSVVNYKSKDQLQRRATATVRDPKGRTTYEFVVDLTNKTVEKCTEFNNAQPGLTFDEMIESDDLLRENKDLLAAFAKRNIKMDDVVFYPFSSGYRDETDLSSKRRIYRPYAAIRKHPEDNYYAHHIDGLVITVDLDSFEVEVEDHAIIPIPPKSGNYDPEGIKSPDNVPYFPDGIRKDLKPFIITQPEGPSFQIDGYQISWQKWRIRVGFNVREGLTMNMVEYFDQNRYRPIFYRAAISEMWVPYGDGSPAHNFKNAFDVGEVGIGILTNSLVLGCDCLGEIRYLDGIVNNNQGQALLLKNAICIHEEDVGLLWKHTEFVEQRVQCRRSRRLVISSMITVGNYEYGLYWYFFQDGTIQFEGKLSGSIAPGAYEIGKPPVSGGIVAEGLYGPHHQHFFNMRIDWMLDGMKNSLVEVNCEPIPKGPQNPAGNAWIAQETILKTVGEARRLHDDKKGRCWKIINSQSKNHVNQPVAYKIIPSGPPCYPLCDEDSCQGRRGVFARNHIWATKYHPEELYAAGLFPNQSPGDDGIVAYSPSFQIDGYQISWQKWRIRVGFNVREGLIMNMVEYFDQNRYRPIFYRAAISEMWIPYADASPGHNYKNAFDVGEAGIGLLTNSLVLGCDCLGEIRYLDGIVNNNQGQALLLKNAICIHEEDVGLLWKHTEFVDQRVQCRRSRRLVISSMITVGNYEYGLYWYFFQDGTIQFEAKLTGSIAPGAYEIGKPPVSGGIVAEGLYGPHHQHFFNMRIDWMLDGMKNSLVEVNCEPIPKGPQNPAGNAWIAQETILKTVGEARRLHDDRKGRCWKIINSQSKNHVNQPVAYKIIPSGPPCYPLCDEDSCQGRRGVFARNHIWATKYHPEELYAAGLFPNQSPGDDGIVAYSEKHKNESLVDSDLVTWYTFGVTHIVRPEDWPIMPIETCGFRLKPYGFFAGSPALDVPPPIAKECHGETCLKH
ncbi:unnamed protein product [Adineta steineri]|uniref:Amine oxidase n=2 Tax=Adineta steineri TaxID=433720 RepID=A0A814LN28_9BILA|nr:unnamed protein product [Adineta steineri]